MIDLSTLEPIGRKQWVKRKWDENENSPVTKSIKDAVKAYEKPTDPIFQEVVDKGKWKVTVDRKVAYLLARKPVCKDHQEELDNLFPFIQESARQYILRGSLIWIIQGDGQSPDKRPLIMNNTIAVYEDEYKETPVAFIRKRVDIELTPQTGAEEEVDYFECYYEAGGVWHRDTWCYSKDGKDAEEVLSDFPVFAELGKTGDAPLFAYVCKLLEAFDHVLQHQDTTVVKNTSPMYEIRGYTGTKDEDINDAVQAGIVKVDGNGGITIHSRNMDSTAIDLWMKRILQEYCEAACIVSKDNELAYAQSGKAMDRLFVDAEASAKQLAFVLEQALDIYFETLGYKDVDIIWNTDRPVDDQAIVQAISASRGLVSDETLLEQHPWVEDVEKELKRLKKQQEEQMTAGMEDLIDNDGGDEDGFFGDN